MTKDEIGDFILETCPEGGEISTGWESGYDWEQVIKIATAAYNLALDHAAKSARIDYYKGEESLDKDSILNLKITE